MGARVTGGAGQGKEPMNWVVAEVFLLLLHAPDGQEYRIASEQVTSLHAPRPSGDKHFVSTVHCLVNLADGKFVSVVETCPEVAKKLAEHRLE